MPQQNINLPTADDVFAKFDIPQKAAAPTAPPTQSDDRSTYQVAVDQMKQVPGGLKDFAASFSPLRFREGYTHPQFEIPQAIQGMGQMVGHTLTGNAMGLMNDVKPMAQPYATLGRDVAATAEAFDVPGFHGIQAPTPPEMQQATRGATHNAAGLAMADIPAMAGRLQGAATRAGIPQALVRAGTAADTTMAPAWAPQWLQHPVSTLAGPMLRATGKILYNVAADPAARVEKVGEYIPPPGTVPRGKPYNTSTEPIDVEPVQPPVPPKMLPGSGQAQLQTGPQPMGLLQAGPPVMPESFGESYYDPSRGWAYRKPPSQGGVMTGGKGQVFGEEGGIPKRGEQTVTGIKPKPVRTPEGHFRKGTAEDVAVEKGNIGRTVRETPKPEPPKPSRAATKKK